MRIVFMLSLLMLTLPGIAQTENKQALFISYPSVVANFQYGSILPTTDFAKGDNLTGNPLKRYEAYTLKMLWQNPGYKDWQKVYRAPYYGAGVTLSNFHNEKEVGHPVSVYGILGIPVKRWQKLELYSEFQFGLACNWKHYDSLTNPKNLVIGGGMTVHLNVGFNAVYPITQRLNLGAGVHFIHFSNGGFERPNNGFNIVSPSVELKYQFRDRPDVRSVKGPGRLPRRDDLFLMLGYGDHQLSDHELDTNYFAVGGLSAIYFVQLSNAFRLGCGTDLNYWWGLNANPDGTIGPRTAENFTAGLILQPEFIIDRLTLVGGFGIYARHLDYGNFRKPYQRLGIRYDIYKNISLGINIRAVNFMLAEFLEFNLGYRFSRIRN
jgi:hypothetical protein